ncbi:MAG: hypothetical protein K8F60_14460 [Melioribacteraceae bacterium]|nr:hypothetical protein [Melioribacteraceae bacterium]
MNYEELLYNILQNDKKYIVLTAENRAAIRNLQSKIPQQFIDTGITEQTMIGVSAGLALRGRIPIAHALATFLTMRPFEFIRTDVGIANLPVKLIGAIPGFLSEANGPTHQAIEDISLMRGIPNMKVFAPADEDDMIKSLPQIFEDNSPCYVRYNNSKPLINHRPFQIGKSEVIGNGNEIALLTYGFLFGEALKTKEMLELNGYSVRLINVRSIKPIDENSILDAIDNCDLNVVIEDHFLTGGLYTIIAELLLKHNKRANIFPISLNDRWFKPALINDVLEYEGFTAEKMTNAILEKYRTLTLVNKYD